MKVFTFVILFVIIMAVVMGNMTAAFVWSLDRDSTSGNKCVKPKTNGEYLLYFMSGYSLGCWLASPVEGK